MSKAKTASAEGKITELLKDLLITSLGVAGVKQAVIRNIVGCDRNRVNRIVKHITRGS